jgi:predicted nucleic acid-binding protein
MTTDYKKIFLDTNVLIYHTFEDFDKEKHEEACNTLEYLSENEYAIYISSQVLREFFAIATNGKFFKRPLSIEEAVSKRKEFENNFMVLYDNDSSISRLDEIALKYQIKKQDIHDANIVATMVTNEIKEIFSFNRKDFIAYEEIKLFETVSAEVEKPNGKSE